MSRGDLQPKQIKNAYRRFAGKWCRADVDYQPQFFEARMVAADRTGWHRDATKGRATGYTDDDLEK